MNVLWGTQTAFTKGNSCASIIFNEGQVSKNLNVKLAQKMIVLFDPNVGIHHYFIDGISVASDFPSARRNRASRQKASTSEIFYFHGIPKFLDNFLSVFLFGIKFFGYQALILGGTRYPRKGRDYKQRRNYRFCTFHARNYGGSNQMAQSASQ